MILLKTWIQLLYSWTFPELISTLSWFSQCKLDYFSLITKIKCITLVLIHPFIYLIYLSKLTESRKRKSLKWRSSTKLNEIVQCRETNVHFVKYLVTLWGENCLQESSKKDFFFQKCGSSNRKKYSETGRY